MFGDVIINPCSNFIDIKTWITDCIPHTTKMYLLINALIRDKYIIKKKTYVQQFISGATLTNMV